MSAPPARRSIRVAAGVPLLQAGLEHAARAASFDLVAQGHPDVWLLGPGEAPTDGAVEVAVDGEEIRIRLGAVPDETVWSQLLQLLHSLVDPKPGVLENDRTTG